MTPRLSRSEGGAPRGRAPALMALAAAAIVAVVPLQLAQAAEKLPQWVTRSVQTPTPASAGKAAALVLHDECVIDVAPDGRRLERLSMAVRILTRDGREAAGLSCGFTQNSDRIVNARAWLIRPSGQVRTFARKEFIDRASYSGELYSEARLLELSAAAEAEAGSVFAWEVECARGSVFPEQTWTFVGRHPVVRSRMSVRVPAGWRAESRAFNTTDLLPVASGNETTWELRDLAAIDEEPAGPGLEAVAPMIAVTVFPPPEVSARVRLQPFASWAEVSGYVAALSEPMVMVDTAIAEQTAVLTRALEGDWEKLRAIAEFVQQVRYVSIQRRLGEGGGFTPHPAPQVLKCGYGDCKDKANLMRALLKATGFESHYVAVAYDDPPVVRDEWPSPAQFNHAIVAIRVGPHVQSSTVAEDAELGRLLFFDPTNENTRFGDLPAEYQGSSGLVVAGDAGRLVRLPLLEASSSVLERTIDAQIDARGVLTATVREVSRGQEAADERRFFRSRKPSEYADAVLNWVVAGARDARIDDIQAGDRPGTDEFESSLRFYSPWYGQSMGGSVLIFKPVMLSRRTGNRLTAPHRKQPVVIRANNFVERTTVALPAGFRAAEKPSDVELEATFGRFTMRATIEAEQLRIERALMLRPAIVPVEEYDKVREFFAAVLRADQQSMVLERAAE